ncbi:unnamed protein product [Cylicocyclus nassatus]|uniref:Uncharacterized protein n=1 Tax=Cylicocyclus nassatus TaxID=53992 RepID=A0AA36DJ76_CYLNA|nr:unnamed protein product [Cylicocyclus nassatus]
MSPHSSSNTVANLSKSETMEVTFRQICKSIKGGFDKDDIDMAMNILKSPYYTEFDLSDFEQIYMIIDKQQEEAVPQRLRNAYRFIRVIGVIMDIKDKIRQGHEPDNWFGSKSFAANEHIFEGEPDKPVNLDEVYNTLVQTGPRDKDEFFENFMAMVLVNRTSVEKIPETYQNDQQKKIKEFM